MEDIVSSGERGTAYYRPLCSVHMFVYMYCMRMVNIGFSMAYYGGNSVRFRPPPVWGSSELKGLT